MTSKLTDNMVEENEKNEKEYSKFNRNSWLLTIGGFLLLALGAFKFFFLQPSFGINLKTQQPVVINGSLLMIIGICITIFGLYRLMNKERTFKEQKDLDNKTIVNQGKRKDN